ncbi:myb-like protein I [Eurosta solidaginis]|uniref:myb-like protein I n=1 Tax=Eurosta solidaginis TaxID=178769 RepID=UPI00353116AE
MAEVEKTSATATNATSDAVPAAEAQFLDIGEAASNSALEYGTSPTQERSSNSHPHDSEYDTASDLEGGVEEYDDDIDDDEEDDDDLDDESISDGESMTDYDVDDEDDIDDGDDDGTKCSLTLDKAEIEAQKKVDEDRSNPQYIPKRGTFYEHDDRTAEVEADRPINLDAVGSEPRQEKSISGVKPPQSPTISHASKTMKKWQPASAVERWSHDRFDPSEQAPKSRSELVSAYGYDIRTEDAPPRARRRRRYGRGPSKYSRNWEDESAYLKASNKERKPPRPSDFPVLNERSAHKSRKTQVTREEKENRAERRLNAERSNNLPRPSQQQHQNQQYQEERRDMKTGNQLNTNNNKGKNYNHQSVFNGRQAPMEFTQKQRNTRQGGSSYNQKDSQNVRNNDMHYNQRHNNRHQNQHHQQHHQSNTQLHNLGMLDYPNQRRGAANDNKTPTYSRQHHPQLDRAYGPIMDSHIPTSGGGGHNNSQHSYHHQQQHMQKSQTTSHSHLSVMRQQAQTKNSPNISNLSQRLQQAQNRNDPSHVGSVQMHALATQSQIVNQQQQLPSNNLLVNTQQQGNNGGQQTLPQQITPQEQRGPPKRYSSLRRSQHEAQHITEQMQQMHLQQQQPPPASMLIQDQHLLQANLMQLYHQENLQAMQQVLQPTNQNPNQSQKSATGYAPVAAASTQSAAYGSTVAANSSSTANPSATYFVASPSDALYTTSATGNIQAQTSGQYGQQTTTSNYLPSSSAVVSAAAATLGYATSGPSSTGTKPTPQPQVSGAPTSSFGPTTVGPNSGAATTAVPATTNTNTSFTNFQNYNTVGGTTYFVPPVQATTRPAALPQRRPTNAIPILPPSEKNKQQQRNPANSAADNKDNSKTSAANNNNTATQRGSGGGGMYTTGATIGSAENIDHIIDNMFVQRPALLPTGANNPTRKSSSPPLSSSNAAADSSSGENSGGLMSSSITEDNATNGGDKSSINTVEHVQLENNVNNSILLAQE